MKVLALNSSPRGGGRSKTELMLNHLVEGMREAGAEVEVVALREKIIKNCVGCFTCWTKTPGMCVHMDDMTNELLPKWLESDLVIYATPLYHFAMTATMKSSIERTLPAVEPFFEIHENRMFHPIRSKYPAAVVLSVSGMPDEGHFGALSAHVGYLYGSPGRKLIAEIYRPAAGMITRPFLKDKTDDVLNATAQAGRELVGSMTISPETMDRITQPLTNPDFFAEMANIMWKTCIAEGVTPKEFEKKKMAPRPDSLKTFLLTFPLGVNPEAFGERKAVLQFIFSGEIQDSCYFTINEGVVSAQIGISDSPDLTIETPFGIWIDIMTGKTDGRQMLKEHKYKISGDITLMMQLAQKK